VCTRGSSRDLFVGLELLYLRRFSNVRKWVNCLLLHEEAVKLIDPAVSVSSSSQAVGRNFHSQCCSRRGLKACVLAVNYLNYSVGRFFLPLNINVGTVLDTLIRQLSIKAADKWARYSTELYLWPCIILLYLDLCLVCFVASRLLLYVSLECVGIGVMFLLCKLQTLHK
jgi:hypothetical protein